MKIRTLREEILHIKETEGEDILKSIVTKLGSKLSSLPKEEQVFLTNDLVDNQARCIAIDRKIDELVKVINETIINNKGIGSVDSDEKNQENKKS